MMKSSIVPAVFALLLSAVGVQAGETDAAAGTAAKSPGLEQVAAADYRAASSQRDRFRHPVATLRFFELEPTQTVVEIWPGAGGWYTELLAPYLKNRGKLYAAHFDPAASADYYRNSLQAFRDKLSASPERYAGLELTVFDPPEQVAIAPAGSADRVLTFRNAHNWYIRGGGDERVLAAFQAFYRALKPGGLLGLVEHRLPESRPASDMESSGYMHQSYLVAMAEKAGFQLLDSSDINANPRDTADHPKGVWTLPPTLRLGEQDRARYEAIGESDRMTLKFGKPDES